MRASPSLLLALAVAWQGGCVRFQPQPISSASSAATFESRGLSDQGLKTFLENNLHRDLDSWPVREWDVTNLTLAALYYSPDLDVARAKWAITRASKQTAGERPNPTLAVIPAYSSSVSVPSPWLLTPTIDVPLETAGKRGYRMDQAAHLSEAARLNIGLAAWQVRSRVRRSLLDLYAARRTQELLQAQQAIQEESIRLLEVQQKEGAVSAFELTQARMASISANLSLRDAQAQAIDARIQLAAAIGVPGKALDGIEFSFDALSQFPTTMPSAQARQQALFNRADILGALAEYAASQSALQLEIAKQYPDVHLNPGYEFDQGNNKWSLGLTVTLPLLNQNKGPIAEATAQRAASAANFNAVQARVIAEIEHALASYESAKKKQAETDLLLASLQKQQQTFQSMFEIGEISRTELASQRLQLSAVSIARLDALVKAQQALGQLEDALQSPASLPPILWQASPRLRVTAETHPHP